MNTYSSPLASARASRSFAVQGLRQELRQDKSQGADQYRSGLAESAKISVIGLG
jgi:hypothetical protein